MPDILPLMHMEVFQCKKVMESMIKLQNGKVAYTLHICSEMLKWIGTVAKDWIHTFRNHQRFGFGLIGLSMSKPNRFGGFQT